MFGVLMDYCVYKYFIHYQYPRKCIVRSILISAGLEAEILTRVVCGLCRRF